MLNDSLDNLEYSSPKDKENSGLKCTDGCPEGPGNDNASSRQDLTQWRPRRAARGVWKYLKTQGKLTWASCGLREL